MATVTAVPVEFLNAHRSALTFWYTPEWLSQPVTSEVKVLRLIEFLSCQLPLNFGR